jgi:hypothetical protein
LALPAAAAAGVAADADADAADGAALPSAAAVAVEEEVVVVVVAAAAAVSGWAAATGAEVGAVEAAAAAGAEVPAATSALNSLEVACPLPAEPKVMRSISSKGMYSNPNTCCVLWYATTTPFMWPMRHCNENLRNAERAISYHSRSNEL